MFFSTGPRFSGNDPKAWISVVEKTLFNCQIHPAHHVQFALELLEGEALAWARPRELLFLNRGWYYFVDCLLWEFNKPYREELDEFSYSESKAYEEVHPVHLEDTRAFDDEKLAMLKAIQATLSKMMAICSGVHDQSINFTTPKSSTTQVTIVKNSDLQTDAPFEASYHGDNENGFNGVTKIVAKVQVSELSVTDIGDPTDIPHIGDSAGEEVLVSKLETEALTSIAVVESALDSYQSPIKVSVLTTPCTQMDNSAPCSILAHYISVKISNTVKILENPNVELRVPGEVGSKKSSSAKNPAICYFRWEPGPYMIVLPLRNYRGIEHVIETEVIYVVLQGTYSSSQLVLCTNFPNVIDACNFIVTGVTGDEVYEVGKPCASINSVLLERNLYEELQGVVLLNQGSVGIYEESMVVSQCSECIFSPTQTIDGLNQITAMNCELPSDSSSVAVLTADNECPAYTDVLVLHVTPDCAVAIELKNYCQDAQFDFGSTWILESNMPPRSAELDAGNRRVVVSCPIDMDLPSVSLFLDDLIDKGAGLSIANISLKQIEFPITLESEFTFKASRHQISRLPVSLPSIRQSNCGADKLWWLNDRHSWWLLCARLTDQMRTKSEKYTGSLQSASTVIFSISGRFQGKSMRDSSGVVSPPYKLIPSLYLSLSGFAVDPGGQPTNSERDHADVLSAVTCSATFLWKIVGNAWLELTPVLSHKATSIQTSLAVISTPVTQCDIPLQGSCNISFGDGQFVSWVLYMRNLLVLRSAVTVHREFSKYMYKMAAIVTDRTIQAIELFDPGIGRIVYEKSELLGYIEVAAYSPSHPSYLEMITVLIVALKERIGSRQVAIVKFIEGRHKSVPSKSRKFYSEFRISHRKSVRLEVRAFNMQYAEAVSIVYTLCTISHRNSMLLATTGKLMSRLWHIAWDFTRSILLFCVLLCVRTNHPEQIFKMEAVQETAFWEYISPNILHRQKYRHDYNGWIKVLTGNGSFSMEIKRGILQCSCEAHCCYLSVWLCQVSVLTIEYKHQQLYGFLSIVFSVHLQDTLVDFQSSLGDYSSLIVAAVLIDNLVKLVTLWWIAWAEVTTILITYMLVQYMSIFYMLSMHGTGTMLSYNFQEILLLELPINAVGSFQSFCTISPELSKVYGKAPTESIVWTEYFGSHVRLVLLVLHKHDYFFTTVLYSSSHKSPLQTNNPEFLYKSDRMTDSISYMRYLRDMFVHHCWKNIYKGRDWFAVTSCGQLGVFSTGSDGSIQDYSIGVEESNTSIQSQRDMLWQIAWDSTQCYETAYCTYVIVNALFGVIKSGGQNLLKVILSDPSTHWSPRPIQPPS